MHLAKNVNISIVRYNSNKTITLQSIKHSQKKTHSNTVWLICTNNCFNKFRMAIDIKHVSSTKSKHKAILKGPKMIINLTERNMCNSFDKLFCNEKISYDRTTGLYCTLLNNYLWCNKCRKFSWFKTFIFIQHFTKILNQEKI